MSTVENFNLFGERHDLPDVVHCETIEARSLVHDWEFTPHRHSHLHQFLLLEIGEGQVLIEEARIQITSGDLVNVPKGTVHGFTFRPGALGWVVTVASELLDESMSDPEGLRPFLAKPDVVNSSNEIRGTVSSIFAEYPSRGFARAHILRALSIVMVGLVVSSCFSLRSGYVFHLMPLLLFAVQLIFLLTGEFHQEFYQQFELL